MIQSGIMERRHFLASIGAATAPASALAQGAAEAGSQLRISAVEVWRVEGELEYQTMQPGQGNLQPSHVYDELRPKPLEGDNELVTRTGRQSRLYLKIKTDGGLEGLYGPIDQEGAIVVHRQLRPFLIGKDPLAVERLWDQLFRINRHSRRGHYMIGISAVDNALWDLRGRYFGAPVYRLLGGPTRGAVQAYGSMLGHSVAPGPAARRALEFKQQGFVHQKWFLAYGPGDGAAGMAKNLETMRQLRRSVGDDVDLMFDAFSGWDLNYAKAWAARAEQFRPRFIEEAVHPEKIDSFVELRRGTSIPVASGEHIYNRWEVLDYLKQGALDVVQCDPEWCGGVSELVKICAVASAYDVQVIPHGHSLHAALHVVASQSPMTCPLVEYLINKMRSWYLFEKHELKPVDGRIALPDRPGFGIELDEAKIDRQTLMEL